MASEPEPTVYVVDDDRQLCEGLRYLLETEGFRVEIYTCGQAFLRACRNARPGCVILDLRMRGTSGLEVQNELAQRRIGLPVIVLTAHGDIPTAVRAVKAGALDFLQKPVDDEVLLGRVRRALALARRNHREQTNQAAASAGLAALTPREREVLELVVAGMPTKQIAARLHLSQKTIEVHRKHLMRKLGARSAVDLVRTVLANGPGREPG